MGRTCSLRSLALLLLAAAPASAQTITASVSRPARGAAPAAADSALFGALRYRQVGPFRGGRVTTVTGDGGSRHLVNRRPIERFDGAAEHEPIVCAFTEQFAVDVTGIGDNQRKQLAAALGDAAHTLEVPANLIPTLEPGTSDAGEEEMEFIV